MPEDEILGGGDEAGIGGTEGGGRRRADTALQPIDASVSIENCNVTVKVYSS